MLKKVCIAGLLFVTLTSVVVFAQIGTKKIQADQRVEKVLKEADVKYTIDTEGDFKLYTKVRDNRIQGVWIISETQNVGSVEVRQIWSIGYISDEPFDLAFCNKLLEQNAKVKLGAWQLRKMSDKYVAVFSAQIGAETDRFSLLLCLNAVASSADDLEKELTNKDVY
jgi:hypothetical protein